MRKSVVIAGIAVMVALAGAATWAYAKYQSRTYELEALRMDSQESRDRYVDAIGEIVAIQDSLNSIMLGEDEDAAQMMPEVDTEAGLSRSEGDMALARISVIKAGVERTRERIQKLDRDLKKRGVRIASLEKMIAGLKRSVAEKEEQLATMTTELDTLRGQVATLATHVEDQELTIAEQTENLEAKRRMASTVYYVAGTKGQLTRSGAITASGGLLGVGRTLEPTGILDLAGAHPVDTDYQTVIRIPSKRVEVITAQPHNSYRLRVVGNETELLIVDPEAFRQIKHLVVMTG